MSVITVNPEATTIHFTVVTALNSHPGDHEKHLLLIQITDWKNNIVAQAEPYEFEHGYIIDPTGPGGFIMTTQVVLEIAKMPSVLPCQLLIQAFVDRIPDNVSSTPLLVRRR
jgi:hypothetical protein